MVEELDLMNDDNGESTEKPAQKLEQDATENDSTPNIENQGDQQNGEDAHAENVKIEEEVKEEKLPENDYSLLDHLIDDFCETPDDDMLPVLCGYFNKIMSSLINKERQRMLEYLLIKRQGHIFDALAAHLNHHSLAQLLIELLSIQIKPEPAPNKKGLGGNMQYDWETSDQENNEDGAENDGVLTPEQEQMQVVLQKKGS